MALRERAEVQRTGEVVTCVVADISKARHTIQLLSGILRDAVIGVEVNASGILRSVPRSKGRAADVLLSVARFVGMALCKGPVERRRARLIACLKRER